MCINQGAREELLFWQNMQHRAIKWSTNLVHTQYNKSCILRCEFNGLRWICSGIGHDVAQGTWSKDEATLSSTWRELKAVDQVLRSYAAKLRGHRVRWFSDNQNVVRIIQVGSRKEHLQDGAMSIYEVCMRYGIKPEVDWIPRSLNDNADYLLRL